MSSKTKSSSVEAEQPELQSKGIAFFAAATQVLLRVSSDCHFDPATDRLNLDEIAEHKISNS